MQPGWVDGRQHIECVSQRLCHTFQAAQALNGGQHMRGVGTLATTRFEPAAHLGMREQGLEETLFGSSCHQSRTKLTQHGEVKALILEFQA